MDIISIKKAEYIDQFKISLTFSTGESGVVNLSEIILKHEAAKPLRDPVKFKNFYLDDWPTLAWNCGYDLSPEYLYFLVTGKDFLSSKE